MSKLSPEIRSDLGLILTPLTTEQERKEAGAILLKDMETTAANMWALIVGMPPEELLGYICAQRMMKMMPGSGATSAEHDTEGPDKVLM